MIRSQFQQTKEYKGDNSMRCIVTNLAGFPDNFHGDPHSINVYWSEDMYIDPESGFVQKMTEIKDRYVRTINNPVALATIQQEIDNLLQTTFDQGYLSKIPCVDSEEICLRRCEYFNEIERAAFNAYSQALR